MGNVFRIALMNMLVLLRLAVVASLALYTLPTAAFAMSGGGAAWVVVSLDDAHPDRISMDAPPDHFDHGITKDFAKNDQKQGKQDCSSDFCISLAIMVDSHEFGPAAGKHVRHSLDDSFFSGQLQSLHRPPSIGA
jgi:hypothetical protein